MKAGASSHVINTAILAAFSSSFGSLCPRYYHPPWRTLIRSDILKVLSLHIDIKTSSVNENNLIFAD